VTSPADVRGASAEPPVGQAIAEFAARLRYEDLPHAVVERAKLLILDAVGIAHASARFPFASAAFAALASLDSGTRPLIGMAGRLAWRDAALMNGVLIHGLDFDDTHLSGIVHVSASALPAALSVASARGLTGRDLLLGYVLGVEITARVGAAANGGFHRAGFHPTGVAGAFGSAVAAGRLAGLSASELATAQGFVGSLAAGTMEFAQQGAWTKRVHPGWAAVAGLTAVAFARNNFVSPTHVYEGHSGLYATHLHGPDLADLGTITKGLGAEWQIDEVAAKVYPSCHFTHACIDAALELMRARDLSVDDIAEVTCLVHQDVMPVVCEPRDRKLAPASDYEAKFSLPFVVAAALVHGRFTLNELGEQVLADARVLDLARRVSARHDPDSAYPRAYSGAVLVRTTDGHDLVHREQINRGAPERPIGADAIIEKFRANLEFAAVERAHVDRVADAVLSLDVCDDVAELAETLAGRSAP
jgi:2-methylcitrate dehydratase PrpD